MSLLRRAALGAGTLLTALALAAAPAAAAPSEQDAAWMAAAHQSNLAEIAAGTAAQEHAASDAVREMGAKLVADHEALDADLTAAADELGVDLPDAPTPEQQATLERVKTHEGEAFDTAWIASQIDGHRMSLAAAQEQISSGQEPAAIALAEAATPVVQGHLDHLLAMAEGAGVPTSVPSGIDGPGGSTLPGAALLGAGLAALAASLLLVRRQVRVRA